VTVTVADVEPERTATTRRFPLALLFAKDKLQDVTAPQSLPVDCASIIWAFKGNGAAANAKRRHISGLRISTPRVLGHRFLGDKGGDSSITR